VNPRLASGYGSLICYAPLVVAPPAVPVARFDAA